MDLIYQISEISKEADSRGLQNVRISDHLIYEVKGYLNNDISLIRGTLTCISKMKDYQKCNIAINTDSQAAIKPMSSYAVDSNLIWIWQCRSKINEVDKQAFFDQDPMSFWIAGNEEADRLARNNARMPLICPESFYGTAKCIYAKEFLEKQKAESSG